MICLWLKERIIRLRNRIYIWALFADRSECVNREPPYGGFPTEKQSTGLFAFISGIRPKLMLLPFLRFASLGISRSAERDEGSSPSTSQGLLAP